MIKNICKKDVVIGIVILLIFASSAHISIGRRIEGNGIEKSSTEQLINDDICNCAEFTLSSEYSRGTPLHAGKYVYYVMDFVPQLPADRASPPPIKLDDLPSEFSWKDYNGGDWMTSAKSQVCGCCWLFAALGALEGVINIARGTPDLDMDLSEQYVLSCLSAAGGCNGGTSYSAFRYIEDTSPSGNFCNGIIPEWCFPYQASSSVPCSDKYSGWTDYLVPISDYGYWYPDGSSNDIECIKTQLMEYGPVVTLMCATGGQGSWCEWGSEHHSPDEYYPYVEGTGANHEVVLVGWKDDPAIPHGGYWICKNSYGPGFGYEGFFNIEYGSLNIDDARINWVSVDDSIPAVIYVDADAGPGGVGSFDHPYQHIQEGITNARFGDTVFVFDGVYYENIVINKTINMIAKNKDTIIDGGNTGNVIQIKTDGVNINGFTIQNAEIAGINIQSGHHNTIQKNTLQNNLYGISLYGFSSDNIIARNDIKNNCYGIDLIYSPDNMIYHNNLANTQWNAQNIGCDNQWDNGYPSGGNCWVGYLNYDDDHDGIWDASYVIDENSEDRYPLMYGYDLNHPVINAYNGRHFSSIQNAIDDIWTWPGHTLRVYSDIYDENIVIDKSIHLVGVDKDDTIIRGGETAIQITTDNVSITGFTIQYTHTLGIDIQSDHNTIFDNDITYGVYGGIHLEDTSDNTISNNNITKSLEYGINLEDSFNNIICDNIIANSGTGIFLFSSSSNTIARNDITNNGYGISLFDSSNDNNIYYNNFNDNTWENVEEFDDSNNQWDDGAIGNYWYDYAGSDSDDDGIGDIPYEIPYGDNHDRYPLMEAYPYTPPPSIQIIDVRAIPREQYLNRSVRILCNVKVRHDIELDTENVKIYITNPEEVTTVHSMGICSVAFDGTYEYYTYWYDDSYSNPGTYHYYITARDMNDCSGVRNRDRIFPMAYMATVVRSCTCMFEILSY